MTPITLTAGDVSVSICHARISSANGVGYDQIPIDDASADLAVFSPPYKASDGYSAALMRTVADLCARVLKPGSRVFMNFGQLIEDFDRPYEARWQFIDAGFIPWQTIMWVKSAAIDGVQRGHYTPLNSKAVLNYGFEHVFQFIAPGAKPCDLDRLSIGVPFTDKSNMARGNRGANGDLHCAGDVWFVPYKTTGGSKKKRHNYSYPLDLVQRIIRMSALPRGSMIFDPFMGGGTTAEAARSLGMNSCGVEMDDNNVAAIIAAWGEAELREDCKR